MNNPTVNTNELTVKVIGIVIAVIAFALILVPIVEKMTQEEISIDEVNIGNNGIDLALFDGSEHDDKSVAVSLSGSNIVISGTYSKTLSAEDGIVMVSDKNALYTQNGSLYFFDGTTVTQVENIMLDFTGNTVNGQTVSWVYFPETDGEYSSYNNGYRYQLSDAVGVGGWYSLMGAISNGDNVTVSVPEGVTAHVNVAEDNSVLGVTYNGA